MPEEHELNKNSTDYVIGQLTISLETTTKALNNVTDRLQIVTMTVETLNSKLNMLSDLYSRKIDSLEKGLTDLEKRSNRDYVRLEKIESKLSSVVTMPILEERLENNVQKLIEEKPSNNAEQRVFLIIISVLSVITTIVALVK